MSGVFAHVRDVAFPRSRGYRVGMLRRPVFSAVCLTFVAVVGLLLSIQADTLDLWHRRDPPPVSTRVVGSLVDIAFGKGVFVAVGRTGPGDSPVTNGPISDNSRGKILTSRDGVSWIRTYLSTNLLWGFTSVIFDQNRFIAVGYLAGSSTPRPFNVVAISTNGLDWIENRINKTDPIRGLAHGNECYVGVGGVDGKGFMHSTNAIDWVKIPMTNNPSPVSVAFGNDTFVAVDYPGAINGYTPGMWTSTDGLSWINRPSKANAKSVTFGNGMFVAVGLRDFTTSPDGIVWSSPGKFFDNVIGFPKINEVTYCNGFFVTVGYSYYGLPFFGERSFILAAYNNARLSWTDIGVANNLWNTNIFTMKDLIPEDRTYLRKAAYGDGTIVAVGDHGVIVQSVLIPSVRMTSPNTLEVIAPLVASVSIEASSDMSGTWSKTLTFLSTNAVSRWADPGSIENLQRFYRFRLQPGYP